MPADRLRLFFALWPDPAARARLAVLAATVARDRRGRATATGNLHVTLAFLGNVAPPLLPVIESAGAAAAGQCPGFNVYFDRLGGAARGDIAWLACNTPDPGLLALHRQLAAALDCRGLSGDGQAFRPHVTLARHCARPAARQPAGPVA